MRDAPELDDAQHRAKPAARLAVRPPRARAAMAVGTFATYVLIFLLLYARIGLPAATLVLVPVIVAAWLFGQRGGLIAALIAIGLNMPLGRLAGETDWFAIFRAGGGLGPLVLVLAGLVVGRLRDLSEALRRARDELQQRVVERTEALRASEAQYRLLFESNPQPMWVYDLTTLAFLAVNDAAVHHYGYTRQDFLAMTIKDIRPPEEAPALLDNIAHSLAADLDQAGVWRHRRKDGSIIQVEITTHSITFAGRPARLVLASDITESARAETVRAATHRIAQTALMAESLEALYGSIHAIIGELMPARNFYIALYDAAADLLDWVYFVDEHDAPSPPHKPGKGLTEYVLRAGQPLLASPDVFRELVQQGEVELIGVDSVDWLGAPLQTQDKTIGVLAVQSYTEGVRYTEEHRDILTFVSTQVAQAIERRRAEAALRDSQTRLAGVIASAMDAIISLDAEQRIILFNPAAEQMFGCPAAEAIGQPLDRFIPERFRDAHREHIRVFGQTNQTRRSMGLLGPLTCLRADGEEFPAEISISQIDMAGRKIYTAILRDVTERTRMEKALQESESLRRLIIETAPECVRLVAPDGRLLEMNRAGLAMIEADSLAQVKGAPFLDLVAPEYRQVFGDLHERVIRGETGQLEFEIIGLKGTRRWLETTAVPLRDEREEVTALLGVSRDITERKQAEEALRRYAQRLEGLQEIDRAILGAQSPEEIIRAALSRTRRLIDCERAGASLFDLRSGTARSVVLVADYPVEPLEGVVVPLYDLPPLEILRQEEHLPDLAAVDHRAPLLDRLLAAGIRSTFRVPLIVEGDLIGDLFFTSPRPAAFAAEHLDIIREVAAQVAVAMQQARLREQLQRHVLELESLVGVANALRAASTRDAMVPVVVNQAIGLFQAQGAALETVDPASGELMTELGVGVWASATGVPIPLGAGLSAQIIATGRPYLNNDVLNNGRLFRPDLVGECRAVAGVPLIAEARIIGRLWIARTADITEADLRLLTAVGDIAANALHRADIMETLEQRVAERTRELAEANQRLTELDRLKSKFVSDVSHELRQPVTNLSLYLNLLERGKSEKRADYLNVLHEQTARLGQLIEDILDLSRLEARWAPSALAPVDLNAIVEPVVAAHRPVAEAAGLALVFEAGPNLPPVLADRSQLARVVSNLMANAINYTRAGQVTVTARAESGGVVLRVQDTGIGIDPEDRPHLFERFYRGRRTTPSDIPGTGLGLAIVKEIVERHGGRIDVESRPGQGSTFRVWFPSRDQQTA